MTTRGRRVMLALAIITGLLFSGRWTAEFLAEQWWTEAASPIGAVFAIRWALLRVGLEVTTFLVSVAWFAAGLLLAARLGGRAARIPADSPDTAALLRPELLRQWGLGIAVLLGILWGIGSGSWAAEVALAAQSPRFGLLDAQFGWDVGFFLATLPVLQRLEGFLLGLALLGFVATTMLYAVAGALRVTARHFVLDPSIRLHLGALGAILALVLGAGYLLQPLELAVGLRPSVNEAQQMLLGSLARIMVGFSLAVAGLTLLWGLRGRMMIPIGAWASYALFAIAIRLLAPSTGAAADSGESPQAIRELEQEAFGIPVLEEGPGIGSPPDQLEALAPELWSETLVGTGTARWLAADRLAPDLPAGAGWELLLVAAAPDGVGALVHRVAGALVSSAGGPLTIAPGGAEPQPGMTAGWELRLATMLPGERSVRVLPTGSGIVAGGFFRRLGLTWALQKNLLGVAPGSLVSWRRDPGERLRRIAPFADWSAPRPRIVEGRLVWVSDGYLSAAAFPGVAATPWRGRPVAYLRAGFTGVVDGAGGKVRVFERGDGDPITRAWATIARDLVEPAGEMLPALAEQLHYPSELFGVQSRVLQRPHWGIGTAEAFGTDSLAGPVRRLAYLQPEGRRIVAILEAEHRAGADLLRLLRYDSSTSLDGPVLLAQRWGRLPFVAQMSDSVRVSGARLVLGPVQLAPTAQGLAGYQTGHAVDSSGRATLALVNVALGSRLGTGPRTEAAWQNLRGEVAALPVSVGASGQLREARLWLLRADSAFRKGDLPAFGRAFEALRAILDYPPGPPK